MNVNKTVLLFVGMIVVAVWASGTAFLGSTGRTVYVWDEPVTLREDTTLVPAVGSQQISLTLDIALREGHFSLTLWDPEGAAAVDVELWGPASLTEIFHLKPQAGDWCLVVEGDNCRCTAVVEWQGLRRGAVEE